MTLQQSYWTTGMEEALDLTFYPEHQMVAECSQGYVGLVTGMGDVTYEDGTTARAWVGIHLGRDDTRGIEPGSPWSSRTPSFLYKLEEEYSGE